MDNSDFKAEAVVQKIKHYLIATMGRTCDEASDEELYRAFCYALREEIMVNWTATSHTFKKMGPRKLYYLSMEYMPGRLLHNNVGNIGALELVKRVIKKLGREFKTLAEIEPDMGIGNGGLGRLASCFMDSLATLQYPAMGYGLRYQYGIFEQALWLGVQIEKPDSWLQNDNPWEFRRDPHSVQVNFSGDPICATNIHGEEVFHISQQEEVRALAYDYPIIGYRESLDFSVLTLRLWSTKNSPRNFELQKFNAGHLDQAAENTSLTDVLYPNDNHDAGKRMRLKQEFLLVSASLQDIIFQHLQCYPDMKEFADKVRIQINDTHPTLVIAELIRVLTVCHDFSYDQALEATRTICGYTNHTVLREALEEWNIDRFKTLLPRQYTIIERLNKQLMETPGYKSSMAIIDEGQVKMAHLAIFGSHAVNGVAKLHSQILREKVFPDFSAVFPEKFTNVTNGVTQRRWLYHCNPDLSEWITERIGSSWIMNFSEMEKLREFASDEKSQKAFIEIKQRNKQKLLTLITEVLACHDDNCPILSPDALFDVQIKRFHEYKRQLMKALHVLMIYKEIRENPGARSMKRLVIFAGKAAPGYDMAKNIIRLIYCIARKINFDPATMNMIKMVFIENYNVSKAEIIIPGADLSQQISTAGMEASGTGNMKFSMNGSLTIGTDDGANVEMREQVSDQWWPFKFGASAEENIKMHANGTYNPHKIIEADPEIAHVIESLRDESLVENEAEHKALTSIYHALLSGHNPDRYFVLNDLRDYYNTQKKVEELYLQPDKWAETAIHNMAGMGQFSTDISIKNYADNIWDIEPCPVDPAELKSVNDEFSEHDRCQIVVN